MCVYVCVTIRMAIHMAKKSTRDGFTYITDMISSGIFAWKVRNTRGQHEGADPSQRGAQRDAVASRLYLVPRFQADKFSFLGSVLDG